MTPGTPDAQVAALGELLGMTPGSRMDKTVALVALAAEAQRRGMTWADLAPVFGAKTGREAKATVKRLAKIANRKMLATAMNPDAA